MLGSIAFIVASSFLMDAITKATYDFESMGLFSIANKTIITNLQYALGGALMGLNLIVVCFAWSNKMHLRRSHCLTKSSFKYGSSIFAKISKCLCTSLVAIFILICLWVLIILLSVASLVFPLAAVALLMARHTCDSGGDLSGVAAVVSHLLGEIAAQTVASPNATAATNELGSGAYSAVDPTPPPVPTEVTLTCAGQWVHPTAADAQHTAAVMFVCTPLMLIALAPGRVLGGHSVVPH